MKGDDSLAADADGTVVLLCAASVLDLLVEHGTNPQRLDN
jgi:hypothetical protein